MGSHCETVLTYLNYAFDVEDADKFVMDVDVRSYATLDLDDFVEIDGDSGMRQSHSLIPGDSSLFAPYLSMKVKSVQDRVFDRLKFRLFSEVEFEVLCIETTGGTELIYDTTFDLSESDVALVSSYVWMEAASVSMRLVINFIQPMNERRCLALAILSII